MRTSGILAEMYSDLKGQYSPRHQVVRIDCCVRETAGMILCNRMIGLQLECNLSIRTNHHSEHAGVYQKAVFYVSTALVFCVLSDLLSRDSTLINSYNCGISCHHVIDTIQ